MSDEQTTPTDTEGKEDDKPVENTPKPLTPAETLQALKDTNDETEKELIREQELRAKVSAQKALGGETVSEPSKPKDETDKDYRDRVTKEMSEGKTEFGN